MRLWEKTQREPLHSLTVVAEREDLRRLDLRGDGAHAGGGGVLACKCSSVSWEAREQV